jgi:hypothetical protein
MEGKMTAEERRERIEAYGSGHAELMEALKDFPREMWQWKPAPRRWSIHEILVHLADSEANGYIRARRFIAEPGKTVMAYDQEEWARKLRYQEQSPEEAVELFKCLRQMTYKLIKPLPESVWANRVEHPEYGPMNFDRWLEIYAAHIPGHIKQMRGNLEEWKKQQRA